MQGARAREVAAFRELWHPENLERLARAYWRYLGKISLGLIRVVYESDARTVVLLTASNVFTTGRSCLRPPVTISVVSAMP